MITLFRNTELTRECNHYSYGVNQNNSLTWSKLKDNEVREPRIKIEYCTDYFNGYYSAMGLFTYVGFQALSKLLSSPLKIRSRSTRSPDTYLNRDLNNYKDEVATETAFTIDYMAIAPSNMERSCVRNKRNEIGESNENLDKSFEEFSNSHIFGTTTSNNKHNILIFINIKESLKPIYQIMSLILIFRLIDKLPKSDVTAHEYEFFEKLSVYFAQKKFKEEGEKTTYNLLKNIFLEYIDGLDEYIIDQTSEFKRILTTIRERKFSSLKQRAERANEDLKRAIDRIADAQREYDEANTLYAAALTIKADDCELQLKEAMDLLSRSPRITNHGLDGAKLWFTMLQPLSVNEKTEWQRISTRLFPDDKIRGLINKTLVDEEYELWTEASVAMDFETSHIARYGSNGVTTSPTAIPHPHVANFGCFGQHSAIIGNLIAEADFLGAVEQSIEAGSGLNWADGPVTNRLAQGFATNGVYTNIKCFKTKNGTWFSAKNYLEGKLNETSDKQNTEANDIHNS